jgi:hypothetical protein
MFSELRQFSPDMSGLWPGHIQLARQIVRRNQEIIHSQRDEPLQEFPDVPVFPPVPDPYGSLTPAKLATFDIGPTHVSSDDDDEVQADDDEETEDDE